MTATRSPRCTPSSVPSALARRQTALDVLLVGRAVLRRRSSGGLVGEALDGRQELPVVDELLHDEITIGHVLSPLNDGTEDSPTSSSLSMKTDGVHSTL